MNKTKIIQLLEDGAEFHQYDAKLVHPSFVKGFRTMHVSNISWQAVEREHGSFGTNRLFRVDGVFKLRAPVFA